MRSIRYLITGNPHNLDDCLDLSCREKPLEISMALEADETINSEVMVKHLIGIFRWKFPSLVIEYKKIYAGCFAQDSKEVQKSRIENANRILEECLEKIKKTGVEVKGMEKRFDYSHGNRFWVVNEEKNKNGAILIGEN
ncbi:MAG: hypothetical protein ABIA63_09325 [bacterium]